MDSGLNSDDLIRLNALVDGELTPDARATLAARLAGERDLARAYATLARLKATTSGLAAEPMPALSLPTQKRKARPNVGWLVAGLAAVLALGLSIGAELSADRQQAAVPAAGPTAITLASLPAGASIPRLDAAGLTLIGLAIEPGRVPLFTATYRGPHGCRLDLRAWPQDAAAPALSGTDRHRWTTSGLIYELVAHGMPKSRFSAIAAAAEQQTWAGTDHNRIDRRLREANIAPPPCLG